MFEKHGQTSRAMQIYNNMDPNDPQVKLRSNQILHNAALKLQRIFRGHKARKLMLKNQAGEVMGELSPTVCQWCIRHTCCSLYPN